MKFISLICDGSTDSSRTEAELAFIRCCHKGSISVYFVGVKNVDTGDAQGMEVANYRPCSINDLDVTLVII